MPKYSWRESYISKSGITTKLQMWCVHCFNNQFILKYCMWRKHATPQWSQLLLHMWWQALRKAQKGNSSVHMEGFQAFPKDILGRGWKDICSHISSKAQMSRRIGSNKNHSAQALGLTLNTSKPKLRFSSQIFH